MTPYQINNAVMTFINSNWTATSILTENTGDAPALPFINVNFKPGSVEGIEIHGSSVRAGVLMIDIYTNKGVGIDEGLVYGGLIESLFHHKSITDTNGRIICENGFMMPYTETLGIDTQLQAYHTQTVIPFSVISD